MAFNLHRSLVCKESARLSKTFQGAFKEAAEQECTLSEEDPRLFGYFVEYLYREGWLHDSNNKTDLHLDEILILARLYTMGDRLMAKDFQDLSLRKFAAALDRTHDLPDQDICNLLETVGAELPDTSDEEPLQAQVTWYAAARMSKLQKLDRFPELLREHPQLAVRLCMRAGNRSDSRPAIPATLENRRFKPESTYY